jgi:hypothetical protein
MNNNVWEILRKRYPANEYALMSEVRDAAGFGASRSADFILFNLWPSRGLHLSGIELKSSRSDWLRELKHPKKAEAIFTFCDFFWLLTEEKDEFGKEDSIAKLEEIPINWGWMAIKKGKIHIRKEAPKLEPKPVDRDFLGAMLKRACDKTNFVHIGSIEERVTNAREAGREEAKNRLFSAEKELEKLKEDVQAFYKASGINLHNYYRWHTDPTKIGAAVKMIEEGGAEAIRKQLINLQGTAESILASIAKHITTLTNDTGTKDA